MGHFLSSSLTQPSFSDRSYHAQHRTRLGRAARLALLDPNVMRFACIHSCPSTFLAPIFFYANHSLNFDHRRRPEALRTAMATAFFCPTKTTSHLPLVTPV